MPPLSPPWNPQLSLFRIQPLETFYFRPFQVRLHGRLQQNFFELSVFGFENSLYLGWKAQKEFEDFLLRSGIHTELPVKSNKFFVSIGFALPTEDHYPQNAGPWLKPVFLDLAELPPFQDSPTDWFAAQAQDFKVMIWKPLHSDPVREDQDAKEIEIQLALDTRNFPSLEEIFKVPTEAIINAAYGIDIQKRRVPANLLPPVT